jgi:hypothetical protein
MTESDDRASLWRSMTRRVSVTAACIVVGFAVGLAVGPTVLSDTKTSAPVVDKLPTVADSHEAAVADLLERHRCWTAKAPPPWRGKLPAAAVVTPPGATMPSHGSRYVGPALEHVFEGKHPGLVVHGFCAR